MNPPKYTSLPDRFWDKVEVNESTGCWEWTAFRFKGYGVFGWHGKSVRAHRLSALDAKGAIPKGQGVLHHCDNPPCVFPEHLHFGTQQDNMDDMVRRKRSRNGRLKGERNPSSKLTVSDVVEARALYATGNYTYTELGVKFGVTPTPMCQAIKGIKWGHVPGRIKTAPKPMLRYKSNGRFRKKETSL